MSKIKSVNVAELVQKYDENYVNSISLKNITSYKELKALLKDLEIANYVVTSFYEMMYNDYITMINNDSNVMPTMLETESIMKYKNLSSKIQKAYSYILYISTFENPFKQRVRKA